MTHQVLARKWRPRDFTSLVGQEHVVKALTHALTTQRLHHAYLFTGTRGVGKTTLSRILAKALNCETGITATPCGKCRACLDVDAGRFVDYVEMDAASNRSVDEMTAVLDNAVYAPTSGRYKVYVIDEVHMLTNHAFNAMLKTLEEPPPHICFVLATTDPQKVPVTVLSRCMQFNLRNLAPQTIADRLAYILGEEKIAFEEPALMRLGRAASGSMRDSLSLLDQAIAFSGGDISDAAIMQMLGMVDSAFVDEIIAALAAEMGVELVRLADELLASGGAFEQVLLDLAREFQQLALAYENLGEHSPERIALAKQIGAPTLQVYYQIVIHGAKELALAPDAHTGFVMVLLRLVAFTPRVVGLASAAPRSAVASANRTSVTATAIAATAPATSRPALAAQAPAPAAVPVNSTPASNAHREFDGDWPALARSLQLVARPAQFMQQSQLVSVENLNPGYGFVARIAIKMLAEPVVIAKVKDALIGYFGQPIALKVEIGEVQEGTHSHIVAAERADQQSKAEAAIAEDPFVQAMQNEMGATIIPGSIKSVS